MENSKNEYFNIKLSSINMSINVSNSKLKWQASVDCLLLTYNREQEISRKCL